MPLTTSIICATGRAARYGPEIGTPKLGISLAGYISSKKVMLSDADSSRTIIRDHPNTSMVTMS
jgi:hypothetical protein